MIPMHGEYKYLIEVQQYTCLRRSSQPTLPASGVHPAPNPIARSSKLQSFQCPPRGLSHRGPLAHKFLPSNLENPSNLAPLNQVQILLVTSSQMISDGYQSRPPRSLVTGVDESEVSLIAPVRKSVWGSTCEAMAMAMAVTVTLRTRGCG